MQLHFVFSFLFSLLLSGCLFLSVPQNQKTMLVTSAPEPHRSQIRLTYIGALITTGIILDNGKIVGAFGQGDSSYDDKRTLSWEASPGRHRIEVREASSKSCDFWDKICIEDQSGVTVLREKPQWEVDALEIEISEGITDLVLDRQWLKKLKISLAKESYPDHVHPMSVHNGYPTNGAEIGKISGNFLLLSRAGTTGRLMVGYHGLATFGLSYARTHISIPSHKAGEDFGISAALNQAITRDTGIYMEMMFGGSRRYYAGSKKIEFSFLDYMLGFEYRFKPRLGLLFGASYRLNGLSNPNAKAKAGKEHNDLKDSFAALSGLNFLL